MAPAPNHPRPQTAGPDAGPEAPFPLKLSGKVIKGFGRGSKELGIPTANLPVSGTSVGGSEIETGIYYGWAGLSFSDYSIHTKPQNGALHADAKIVDAVGSVIWGSEDEDNEDGYADTDKASIGSFAHKKKHQSKGGHGERAKVYPMVMSVGWNPFYKNEVRSVEIHIMHQFPRDFYGARLNVLVLGYLRPEFDYVDKESLIKDIREDIEIAGRSLARKTYASYRKEPWLREITNDEEIKKMPEPKKEELEAAS